MHIFIHGAALHPAARYWGLTRQTANQKIVEPLCADLGYAVKKLMPVSSLAASPILAKEDALDSGWKSFIDSLRSFLDERGQEMMDESVLKSIKAAVAPRAGSVTSVAQISAFADGNVEFTEDEVTAFLGAPEESEDEDEETEAAGDGGNTAGGTTGATA